MITHDEIAYSIVTKYPHLVHGKDFWVGQRMNGDVQEADAEIMAWYPTDIKQPTVAAIRKMVRANAKAFQLFMNPLLDPVTAARAWRDTELARADVCLLKAEDGDGVGTVSEWREYRKALRAWPEAEGFPADSSKPKSPDSE